MSTALKAIEASRVIGCADCAPDPCECLTCPYPDCGWKAPPDAWDVLGAEPSVLFCIQCNLAAKVD